ADRRGRGGSGNRGVGRPVLAGARRPAGVLRRPGERLGGPDRDPALTPPGYVRFVRPAISAHRGGGEVHPAQTHAAFADAASCGVEYSEFAVRSLADGSLVCFHDAAIDGTPLARLTYAALRGRAGYDVPLVETVLDLLAGKAIAHIDLKEIGYES